MNVSINWLKEYIDLNDKSVKEIADGLTLAGLEAEGFHEIAALSNVVTAKVISKEKHPNADKLSVCKVTDGTEEYQVVWRPKCSSRSDCAICKNRCCSW